MDLSERLITEWRVISQAPTTFAFVGVAMLAACFVGLRYLFSERLESLNSRLALRDDQIANYRGQLEGASPDEARARLDGLRDEVSSLQSKLQTLLTPKRQLSENQKQAMADQLKHASQEDQKRLFEVIPFSDAECSDFASDIVEAIRGAGFNAQMSGFIAGGPNPRNRGLELSFYSDVDEALTLQFQTAIESITRQSCPLGRENKPGKKYLGRLIVNRPLED